MSVTRRSSKSIPKKDSKKGRDGTMVCTDAKQLVIVEIVDFTETFCENCEFFSAT